MKKLNICIMIIVLNVCILFTGCAANEDNNETKYVNNELTSSALLKQATDMAGSTLLGNDVCVIDKSISDSEDTMIKAEVALLINRTNKQLVFAKQPFKKMYPASLTKVATTLMTYNNIEDLKKESVTVSNKAASITEAGAKLCGFQEGDVINLYDLVTTMMVYSGNDAAQAIAEHVGNNQKEFCLDMSKMSQSLGASVTNFVNPHGLHSDEQVITAYDMYLIFDRMLEYKDTYKVAGTDKIDLNYVDKNGVSKKKTFTTTNKYLLGQAKAPNGVKVVAGKTGTTNKAGSCLILLSTNSKNEEFISVILNARTSSQLYSEMTRLLSYIK